MAELFNKDTDTLRLHLENIYAEQELKEKATTGLFPIAEVHSGK
jgi:hypothetical protein